ncbi:hypothetical protein GCM10027074_20680 [Streptomyces deserti]
MGGPRRVLRSCGRPARTRREGIEGLRVADGSVMPDLVTVNPCIATMMTGGKCADLVKEDA